MEHILDEYKSQAMKAMKEAMIEDHVHKKLSDNLKLHKMQYVSLHSDLKTVKYEIENNMTKHQDLFDTRLPAYTMLTMDKKPNEESKIELRMNQLEGRVGKVGDNLQLLVNQAVHTNEIILKLLEAQNSNPNDNKKGEKCESLRKS